MAYFFHWDAYSYKRTQDILVIIIGVTAWILSANYILIEKINFFYFSALILSTIIVAMHILRAINGDLLC